MNITALTGVTALAALVALTGLGCSSNPDTEAGDQDSGASHDGSAAHDGGQKDTSAPPPVDGGADAEVVPDSSAPVDGSNDVATKDGGSDAEITDATASDAHTDAGDAGPNDASSNVDAPVDAPADAPVDAPADAIAHDASHFPPPDASDPDGALVCAPADMSSFQPTWHGPVPHSSSCSAAQIAAYHQCLTDSQTQASPASCNPFSGTNVTPANKACVSCILTQDTAASYGAIVVHKGTIEINVPGCLALATGDTQGAGCAGKIQGSDECRNAACAADCPVTDEASFQLEQQCEAAAGTGTCKPEVDAATCADALVEAGGAPAACLTGQTFDDLYDAVVPVFCGP